MLGRVGVPSADVFVLQGFELLLCAELVGLEDGNVSIFIVRYSLSQKSSFTILCRCLGGISVGSMRAFNLVRGALWSESRKAT